MLEAILALAVGLLIGSFLNVCIYRLPRDRSVVTPRSFCPACDHTVAWYDNVPLLSFLVLRGRCRHCAKPISPRYPLVEALTGLLFFAIVFSHGLSAISLKLCAFAALIVGLVFSDLEERILPDEFTLGGTALGIAFAAVAPTEYSLFTLLLPQDWGRVWLSVIDAALSAAVASGILWLVGRAYHWWRHREGLGFGDVKMAAMIGAFLGLQGALLALILGSLLGSVLGLIYIFAARKDASTYELPFGTFLGAAALAFALLQGQFFTWFLKLAL
jgi:leader peptidase (prepilin peptidase) / N-methyltransferase